MTGGPAAEPTLDDVQAEFPAWRCWEGVNRLCHARHTATGTQVRGEDPLDLRDQIRAAEARLSSAQDQPGPAAGQQGER